MHIFSQIKVVNLQEKKFWYFLELKLYKTQIFYEIKVINLQEKSHKFTKRVSGDATIKIDIKKTDSTTN